MLAAVMHLSHLSNTKTSMMQVLSGKIGLFIYLFILEGYFGLG